MPLVLLVACADGATSRTNRQAAPTSSPSAETSVGASVPADDPTLTRADAAGNTPPDVLLSYVRAWNRTDWKTVYSLTAPPKESYASWGPRSDDAVPWDDFQIHETRIVERNRALVRVTYATIGFSSLEGLPDEERRRVVVVRDPGEWWVLVKSDLDDATWQVTHKGPLD